MNSTAGFGITLPLLAHAGPPAKHPWLTLELIEREAAIGERQDDVEALFFDSLAAVRADSSY